MSLITEIQSLIGVPPTGYEFLEYLLVGVFLLFLVSAAVSIVSAIFKWIGGF